METQKANEAQKTNGTTEAAEAQGAPAQGAPEQAPQAQQGLTMDDVTRALGQKEVAIQLLTKDLQALAVENERLAKENAELKGEPVKEAPKAEVRG
jgi:hypothetical protein